MSIAPLFDWEPFVLKPVVVDNTERQLDRLKYKLEAVLALGKIGQDEREAIERIKTEMDVLQETPTLLAKLDQLAERWQNAEAQEARGEFSSLPHAREATIVKALCDITQRYDELWHTLATHNPQALQGRLYLGYDVS
jgi:hypothetical protein